MHKKRMQKNTILSAFTLAAGLLCAGPVAASETQFTVTLRDTGNNAVCLETGDHAACVVPGAITKDPRSVARISTADGFDITRTILPDEGIACYESDAGLWCAALRDRAADAPRPPVDGYKADFITLGEIGNVSRFKDPETGLVIYGSSTGLSGAVPGPSSPDQIGNESLVFRSVDMARVRDHDGGAVCFSDAAARRAFSCATLHQNYIRDYDERIVLRFGDPLMRYSVVDSYQDAGLVITASDFGVCVSDWHPDEKADKRLYFREVDGLQGQKIKLIEDPMLGVVMYTSSKGLSCTRLLSPTDRPPAPSPSS